MPEIRGDTAAQADQPGSSGLSDSSPEPCDLPDCGYEVLADSFLGNNRLSAVVKGDTANSIQLVGGQADDWHIYMDSPHVPDCL